MIFQHSRKIGIVPASDNAPVFAVAVREGGSESRYRIAVSGEDAARYPNHPPARIVAAAMDFLLDREPRESILAVFDIGVIRRYFPEFDRAFPDYLARVADSES